VPDVLALGEGLGGCDPTFEADRLGDCPLCGSAIPRSAKVSPGPMMEIDKPHFEPG
jgi:hypothetical protein